MPFIKAFIQFIIFNLKPIKSIIMANKNNMTTWMFHMFHKYLIMTSGFKNITQGTQIKGFQINIRTPAYRGLYLSLINSVKLKVDGEEFQFEEMSFKYNGHYFSCNDLKKSSQAYFMPQFSCLFRTCIDACTAADTLIVGVGKNSLICLVA